MTVKKNKDTDIGKRLWDACEKASEEVKTWPEWKRDKYGMVVFGDRKMVNIQADPNDLERIIINDCSTSKDTLKKKEENGTEKESKKSNNSNGWIWIYWE